MKGYLKREKSFQGTRGVPSFLARVDRKWSFEPEGMHHDFPANHLIGSHYLELVL
jgi:hypothetical protein